MVLQIGTPGFEFKRSDLGSNIKFIGALLPFTQLKKEAFVLNEEYKKYKKVVLVTQGTIEKNPEKIIVPTLEAYKNSDVLVIATTGGSKTAELRARFPHENLIIEDFIPFNDIMPHADVYITNGGYGGVMLGIENNLPLVVAGIHEGKNEINARIGYFKLGINLQTEFPSPEKIRKAVDEVLNKVEYRQNVRKLNQEFKRYNPYKLCEKYIDQILESQSKKKQVAQFQEVLA
jgi:UDP:flavonoid glycosyltransferase YjiC (YdhE family)